MISLMFAAQEHCRHIEQMLIQLIFYLSLRHQYEEVLCVFVPTPLVLFVNVQHVLSGSQQLLMNILRATNLFQKVRKVISFGECG